MECCLVPINKGQLGSPVSTHKTLSGLLKQFLDNSFQKTLGPKISSSLKQRWILNSATPLYFTLLAEDCL